ncbi:MAG: hypothetical protein J3K34DRAFT_440820 [Monoraphidium minutum]|nr:MAG: hypothetical protein J3K34DRAFT_440820 [Monoraphidium minutum]
MWLRGRERLSLSRDAAAWALDAARRGELPCDAELLEARAAAWLGVGAALPGVDGRRVVNRHRLALFWDPRCVTGRKIALQHTEANAGAAGHTSELMTHERSTPPQPTCAAPPSPQRARGARSAAAAPAARPPADTTAAGGAAGARAPPARGDRARGVRAAARGAARARLRAARAAAVGAAGCLRRRRRR